MKISDRRILITGGAGFIGSHMAQQLSAENYVTVLDDFSTGSRENISSLPESRVIDASVRDTRAVRSAIRGCDIVLHMAAFMGVQRTLERPQEVLEVNIDGTRTVLEAAGNAEVDRFVLASTSEVYGDGPEPPYSEEDITAPKTNYAVSKLVDERFTKTVADDSDFEYTILRYFNVFGPRQDSTDYGYVVPIFLRRALSGEPIQVHGDGEQTRDFTFIADAIECTNRALGPAGRNETFNVGTGSERSIRELAEAVRNVVPGSTIEHVDHPRPYTISRRCADVSKVNEVLGYEPEWSLSDGLERTAEYLKSQLDP